jgi:hypothetical protein
VSVQKYSAGNGVKAAAYCKMKLPSKQQMDINGKLDKISFQFRHGVSGWFAIENGQPRSRVDKQKVPVACVLSIGRRSGWLFWAGAPTAKVMCCQKRHKSMKMEKEILINENRITKTGNVHITQN